MKRVMMVSMFFVMAFSHLAQADTRSDVMAAFSRCGVFADDRTWLNCVYGAAQPMRSKLGLPPAPPSQTNLVPGLAQAPSPAPPPAAAPAPSPSESRGGLVSFLLGGQPVLTNVPLTAFSVDRDNLFTITLANGQTWRELEGSPTPHWHEPASSYRASISKGALNSYNLIIVGEGTNYKVQRVH